MIKRYTRPEMEKLWSEENKFQTWLRIEILACEAMAKQGKVPAEALEKIRQKARFSIDRIDELEQTLRHDVVAFITNVSENIGPEGRYLHVGLTSSDVVDTALSKLMVEAIDIIIADVKNVIEALKEKALEHKDTIMIGRTHGTQAEPVTLGLKFLNWHQEMQRNLARLEKARETVRIGKISGVVGTYGHSGPEIEAYVCEKLGLRAAAISTQVLQRDRHAEYLATLAICGTTIEKIATEIRNLQRTEIRELEEPFGKGQKGSSAMPHKRNPVMCEQLCGLARLLRSNLMAALENVSLWHERDISHSSVERVIIPDSTILLNYMLNRLLYILTNLRINVERMKSNLEITRGLIFSQRIMLVLIEEKGLSRQRAYEIVQRNAMRTWDEGISFKQALLEDDEFKGLMAPEELEELMDYKKYLQHVDTIFKNCGLL